LYSKTQLALPQLGAIEIHSKRQLQHERV